MTCCHKYCADFHLGIVKALLHYDMLPQILTGSSAGSLIGACIASRTDSELREFLNQESEEIASFFQPVEGSIFDWVWRWARTGAAVDPSSWYDKLHRLMNGTWTFAEAWQRTGRDLFICVYDGSDQTRVLNWRSSPDVTIASAVIASSALPHVMQGQRLRIKQRDGKIVPLDDGAGSNYFDGSLKHDVPLDHLNTHFNNLNCRYTIVSQVEPHILPFFYCPQGSPGAPEIARRGEGLRGGFILSLLERFIKLDMQKYLALARDLRLTPRTICEFDDAFLQKTWGDVTIRPSMEWYDYVNVFSNPTGDRIRGYMRRGMTAAFPHLCQISHRHKIEKCLRQCCREAAAVVTNQSAARKSSAAVFEGVMQDCAPGDFMLPPPSPNDLRSLSVHESRQIERERDMAQAQLEQEKARCEYLQVSWDEERLKRMKMEADTAALSEMMAQDAFDLRRRRGSSISPTRQRRASLERMTEPQ